MPPRSVSFRKSIISFPYISYHIMREITICNDDFCNYAIIVSIKQLGDVAMRFRLVAFADEAAPDLAGQIEAMQENGVELLEIRGVDGQNIDGISATKAKVIRKMLGFSGLAVWSRGSPFGKIGINDDFAPHLDSFKHSLELADILGAKHICLFSFYGTSDIDPVLEALAMLCILLGMDSEMQGATNEIQNPTERIQFMLENHFQRKNPESGYESVMQYVIEDSDLSAAQIEQLRKAVEAGMPAEDILEMAKKRKDVMEIRRCIEFYEMMQQKGKQENAKKSRRASK